MTRESASDTQEIHLQGERLLLTAARAVIWPARAALIAADLHIGKAATFRAHGTPVPEGTTADTLTRLSALIDRHNIGTLYLLGDFLHSKHALPPSTLETLINWRERHRHTRMVLIRGNHDARSAPSKELALDVHARDLSVGPFMLTHHPRSGENGYVLSGHLHPAFRLSGRYDSLRLPCYWVRTSALVLPAFGAFTGAHDIMREPGDRVFVLTEDRVLCVP